MSNQLSPAAEAIARQYAAAYTRGLPYHLDRGDFYSVAFVAAFQAERSFDPAKGACLSSWIRGQVWHALQTQARDEDHVSRHYRNRYGDDLPAHHRPPLWLDSPIQEGEEDTYADITPDPRILVDRDGMTEGMRCEEVHEWLYAIEPFMRDLLIRRFWLDQTRSQIGADIGKSATRAWQLECEALQQIREVAQL